MNKGIEFLSDGTVNFYQNKTVNLISAISSLLGLIVFALIIFFFELYKEKGIIFAFGFMALTEIPVIIFFFRRFFNPKIVFIASPKGVEIYRDLKYEKLTWEQINTVILKESNCLAFETKENKAYYLPIGLLSIESQAVLKEILSKHGFFF